MLSSLLTHLNPSSNENLLLTISDLTCLNLQQGESSINYMSRVQGISQRMQGVTIERIIPLFAIASLDHDYYSVVSSRYLAGDSTLVNCNLLQLSSLLSREETRQHALEIPNAPPSYTIANRVSKKQTNPPRTGHPAPQPPQTPI